MIRLKVTLQPTPNHYKVIDEKGNHIKTTSVMYVAQLIEKYGLFFLLDVRKEISKAELCLLGENHYREHASNLLLEAKQHRMAAQLIPAKVMWKKRVRKLEGEEMKDVHSIIFSSGLEVRVTDLHFRLFSTLPFAADRILSIKQEKLAI